jgi:hypothetical protein
MATAAAASAGVIASTSERQVSVNSDASDDIGRTTGMVQESMDVESD